MTMTVVAWAQVCVSVSPGIKREVFTPFSLQKIASQCKKIMR